MAIPEPFRRNFETLLRAASSGDLALLECTDSTSGNPRYVVCAVNRDQDANYVMMPFGHLADGDP